MKTALTFALAVALSAVNLSAQADGVKARGLVGTWRIRVSIPPGSSACPAGPNPCVFAALANVNKDGTAIQTAALPGTSTGHGLWKRTGNRAFRLHTTYFRVGQDGFPVGTAETDSEITLDEARMEASGTYENKVLDLNGREIGSFSATVTGTRLTL